MPNNVIVPEIGTKCIYPVLDAEKIKNFCIQNDSNIIETTGQKVLQTKVNTYYLEHSTDTTAIRSFDNATIIGVVFGLCATWFAWWCAKKSFEITKLSFHSLIEEIKGSAEINFKSNLVLIESQERLRNKEYELDRISEIRNSLFELTKFFLVESKAAYRNFIHFYNAVKDNSENLEQIRENINIDLEKNINSMLSCYFEFTLLVRENDEYIQQIKRKFEYVNSQTIDYQMLINNLNKDNEFVENFKEIDKINIETQNLRIMLKKIISNEDYYNKRGD